MRNLALSLVLLGGVAAAARSEAPPAGYVHVIQITGNITKATADMVAEGRAEAEANNAGILLIEIDTPGGLVEATREIVKEQLNSEIPVVTYVTPRGARAGSAGTFITMAGHIAAMAPSTNIGAAHPIGIGPPDFLPEESPEQPAATSADPAATPANPGPAASPGSTGTNAREGAAEEAGEGGEKKFPFRFRSDREHLAQKIENDTVAWIEGIAKLRGRNVEWARKAVLESDSITSDEALKLGVIDLIATDRQDLLKQIDGRDIKVSAGNVIKLDSAGQHTVVQTMTWLQQLIAFLSSPTVLVILAILMMLGFYVEFKSPGLIFPAAGGFLCLVAILFGASLISVNIVGLLLIIGGFALFFLEFKIVSYGALTVGGVACLLAGAYLLVDSVDFDAPPINWLVMGPFLAAVVFIVVLLSYLAAKAQSSGRAADLSDMVGEIGTASTDLGPSGKVRVLGAYWDAEASQPVGKGEKIRVTGMDGLRLTVEPASSKTPPDSD